jgi:cytochrome b561
MVDPNTPAYTPVARVLHWLTVVLVLSLIPIGLTMTRLDEGPLQDYLFHLHESIGATVIPVIVVRLIYRLTHKPVPLPADIPAIQRLGAETVHWLLYGLLVIQPIVGWIATSAYGAPIVIFGAFNLPPIWRKDSDFSEQVLLVHDWIGYAIAALVCAHIGGALFHHFIRKDRVLLRMVTG